MTVGNARPGDNDLEGMLGRLRDEPSNVELRLRTGQQLMGQGRHAQALQLFREAQSLAPNNTMASILYAQCQLRLGDFASALTVAETALESSSTDAPALDALGQIFSQCGELNKAYSCFEQAVSLAPGNPGLRFNLATACRARGKLQRAESLLEQVIKEKPEDWDAHHTLSQLRRQTPERNHVETLRNALASSATNYANVTLNYALAKEYEDLEDYSAAFEALQAGASLRRQLSNYRVDGDVAVMRALSEVYDTQRLGENAQGHDSAEPIFVLGLPRSGSTLVERILGSHSQVYAAGELQNFAMELVKQSQRRDAGSAQKAPVGRLSLVARSAELDPELLGESYINSTRPRTGHTTHFIDKMPLNFLYIGAIHRALPRAKIVHVTRNPMDACYAMYKTLFQQTYPFSYSLQDLASYYIAYRQLMDHWQNVLGDKLHMLNYEELVANQERVSRDLVEHCGLEWQERCLSFHTNPEPTATASASQVREKVHSRSVDLWRCYQHELGPLYELLQSANIIPERW
ncbi:MAG: sulfotransferase [Pseudomonadota bacterium]